MIAVITESLKNQLATKFTKLRAIKLNFLKFDHQELEQKEGQMAWRGKAN